MDDLTENEKSGFYKVVFSRRDVRSRFTSRPISDSVLVKILNAAHHAPSVGFSQPWNFILIKDGKTRSRIKESFEEERLRSSQLIDGQKRERYLSFKLEGILDSAINICVTYDPSRFGPFVIGRESIPETGIYSVCCAVQNLWLAARAEGLGLGWVSILSNQILGEILELPEHIVPIAYLCLGHVEKFAKKPDLETAGWLPRLDLEEIIYYEKWGGKNSTGWNSVKKTLETGLD